MPASQPAGPVDIELRLLMEAIYLQYSHDFRDYAPASFKRRVMHAIAQFGLPTVSSLQDRILRDPQMFARLLQYLTVPVSEMFRDPGYFLALRQQVMPVLRTYPSIKIWIAGCSTGEEVFSMAILLREEQLLERSIIYATDINPYSLDKARTSSFSDYYTAAYGGALFDRTLCDTVTFADHSLATDSVFAETQFISCRNVMIYFNRALQDRALGLFAESLSHRGFLGLGSKESIDFSAHAKSFEPLVKAERIFRKAGA
jgi:chemotaxis protein methyltransferase CheR